MPYVSERSASDPDAPDEVRNAVAKAIEASQREDYRTAYGYFLRAKKAAGREKFNDLTFLTNIAGLASGEMSRWNDRLKAAKQAFEISKEHTAWLTVLYGIVFEDATGVRLAHEEAKQKLWDVTGTMSGTASGLTWLAGQVVIRQQTNVRKRFEGLAHQILWQLLRNLRANGNGQPSVDPLPDTILQIEELADLLAQEPQGKAAAELLYADLIAVPDQYWEVDGGGPDPQEHKERMAVRLEVVRAAAKSGCFAILLGIVALFATAIGLPLALALWMMA
jgi:hypothetical protein